MADAEYEKEYMEKKRKLRSLHQNLKDTKNIQEIYHKIMGSTENSEEKEEPEED
ncbi:hypothetical protein H6501_02780 [Candidatus Woesearchaeota archaeon]|nr:hypothetical protein [Nanoarchaeota archaeon]MCB9370496.1 hypothetical protein [Candidatus Woesearchaeota archaeon]USN43574.1 MAG: hypothetical protein H6500_04225 [Candidatus Woesearchaeota archaeon]